jgi:hypothetical protein
VCTALADYDEKKHLLSPRPGLTLQLTRNTRQFCVNVYFTIFQSDGLRWRFGRRRRIRTAPPAGTRAIVLTTRHELTRHVGIRQGIQFAVFMTSRSNRKWPHGSLGRSAPLQSAMGLATNSRSDHRRTSIRRRRGCPALDLRNAAGARARWTLANGSP